MLSKPTILHTALIVAALVATQLAAGPEWTVHYSSAEGIGPEEGVMRRDPSDIIRVGNLYYVWYSKGKVAHGYDATVWYATSNDGHTWTEKGEALARGPQGSWDEQSVFTPNILVAEGKYWLYYKGRQWNNTPVNTKMGLAIADRPEGPYVKHKGNPLISGGHEVLVWPLGGGVAAMVSIGPKGIAKTLQYAPDGLTFSKLQDLKTVPSAPGAYRPEAFTGSRNGKMPEWGIHIGSKKGFLPFLARFDLGDNSLP